MSVNYTDGNTCVATVPTIYTVTVNPRPVPVITGPPGVCVNSSGTYSTATGMTGYTWTVSSGGTITAGAGTNSIVIHWNSIGTETVSVTYTDANNCIPFTPTTYTVIINTQPIPSTAGPASICINTSGT